MPRIDSYPTHSATAQALQVLAGGLRLPEHNGVAVDNTGQWDVTDALNAWLAAGVANGDPMFLPAGVYRTGGELVASGRDGDTIHFFGAGAQRSVIAPASNGRNGLRVAIPGIRAKGRVQGIGVRCAQPLPTWPNGAAAFMIDGTPLLVLSDLDAVGFDVGFDFINNCYNCSGYNLATPRFDSANCGLNLREGVQSGSDLHFYNTSFGGRRHAVSIAGLGGGYHFFGGQWGANAAGITLGDGHGVIQLGYDYATQTKLGGLGSLLFSGLGIEGPKDCWMIRSFDEVVATFNQFSFLASAGTDRCLGILKMTDAKNSVLTFQGCNVGTGHFARERVVEVEGDWDSFLLSEGGWHCANGTDLGGTAQGGMWLRSLAHHARGWGDEHGIGVGQCALPGKHPMMLIGGGAIRYSRGRLQSSTDGERWTDLGPSDTP